MLTFWRLCTAETWFHHALAGSSDFLYYNTLAYQLDGSDNQLLSDILKELDALVGCSRRTWVRDAAVNHRQAWVDGYLLTGMVRGMDKPFDFSARYDVRLAT